jgi:hypothetical protein
MELLKKYFSLLLLLPFLFGFRTYLNSTPWDINNDSATNRKIFIKYGNATTNVSNDLGSKDPLGSAGANVTVKQLMDSIMDDFNDVDASFLTLVDDSDTDYAAMKNKREITISFDGATGGNAGEAQFEIDGGKFVKCTINAQSSLLDDAEVFVGTIAHEIGHCLGLAHPQETINSIMSYYTYSDKVRLQIDDKMGMIFLYPKDKSAAAEDATFGLSCARR